MISTYKNHSGAMKIWQCHIWELSSASKKKIYKLRNFSSFGLIYFLRIRKNKVIIIHLRRHTVIPHIPNRVTTIPLVWRFVHITQAMNLFHSNLRYKHMNSKAGFSNSIFMVSGQILHRSVIKGFNTFGSSKRSL